MGVRDQVDHDLKARVATEVVDPAQVGKHIKPCRLRRRNEVGVPLGRNVGNVLLRLENLLEFGTSPRATIFLARASRAVAYLEGRDFVLPDAVKSVA